MRVELVSPERVLYSGDADMVVCRTPDGEIAFLPNHAPFLGALVTDEVRITLGGSVVMAAVHGGFVEVRDNRVIILSDVAELAETIDVPRAEEALRRADETLRTHPDDADAQSARLRAQLRVNVSRR